MHQDPVTKSQRVTDTNGQVTVAVIDLDPWGGETNRSWGQGQQPHRFTSYERDGNGNDQAMFRQYHSFWQRFDQPDPYDGSYDLSDPQSLNRYAYVQNDPVNYVDPTGLSEIAIDLSSLPISPDFSSLWSLIWSSLFGGSGVARYTDNHGGGSSDTGPPQTVPQIDQKKYNDCAKLLGKSPRPPKDAAEAILWTSSKEGTDSTLLAATWFKESSFDFNPGPNPRDDGGFDVGPLQTSTTYFAKDRFINSLSDDAGQVTGTFATKGVPFNGDPYLALRWGARAMNDGAGIRGRPKGVSERADLAGIYRAGSSRSGPYRTRVNEFNALAPGYDAFFNCLRK